MQEGVTAMISPGTPVNSTSGIHLMINIITGDNIVEANETFSIIISVKNPLDRITGPDTITVTILNDDCKLLAREVHDVRI